MLEPNCFALLALVVLCGVTVTSSIQTVRMGGIYPITNIATAKTNVLGAQWLAGSLMAMKDLNADPFFIQSGIQFKLAVRDSRKTFSNTVVGCLALAKTVFKNNGSQVIVGAGYNPVTEAMAYVFSDPQNNLAQVAYASNISSLSHQSVFPDFLRTYPSSSYEGYAIADSISKFFEYTRVVLIYTSDLYGTDGATEFNAAAVEMGIQVVATVSFDPYETNFGPYIDALSEYDPRVFVLIISTLAQGGAVMLYATNTGLFNGGTVLFGTASLASPLLWTTVSSNAALVRRMMGGFFVTSNADNDWKVTTAGLSFIKRYRAQPSTLGHMGPSGWVCNNATDDDGGYTLYRASLSGQAPYNCIGFNFSAFRADGRDVAPYAAYAYDATRAAALGVVAFANINNNGVIPHNINGVALKKVLMSNISFSGYTGQIAFSQGRPHISHYGVGDRTAGVRFVVSNFNPGNGSYASYNLARVATWTTEGGFALCGSDPTLQSSVTGGCAGIDYETPGNVRSPDRPSTIYMVMPKASKAALYFLATVTFCVCVFFMCVLVSYRKTRLLKASQPSMTWIIITANLFSVARIVLAGTDVTVATCVLELWTGHLAFIAVVAMFAKTLRIFIIIKSGLRRIKVTATHVLSFTAVWYIWWILYLVFYSIFGRSQVQDTRVMSLTGQITSTLSCTNTYPVLDTILYTFEGAFLGGSAILCYATKDVPDAINEAKVIALALTVIVIVCAAGFPLTTSLGLTWAARELVIGICFFIAAVGSMSLYFGTKTYLLLSGATLNAQFKIVKKNQRLDGSGVTDKLTDGTNTLMGVSSFSSALIMPKSIPECESQISLLQGHLMVLLEKAVNLGSRSESNGGYKSRAGSVAECMSAKYESPDNGSSGPHTPQPLSKNNSRSDSRNEFDTSSKLHGEFKKKGAITVNNSLDHEQPNSEGAGRSAKISPS